jgi:hypothetical protein
VEKISNLIIKITQVIMYLLLLVIAPLVTIWWGLDYNAMVQVVKGIIVLMSAFILWVIIYILSSRIVDRMDV